MGRNAPLQAAVTAAREGAIPNLKLLTLDVLNATQNAADRCPPAQPICQVVLATRSACFI